MPEAAASSPVKESERETMPTMGFLDHLEELRRRIVYSIVAVVVGFFACWFSSPRLVGLMQRPIIEVLHQNHQREMLVYQHPVDPFNLYLKVAGVAGLFAVSPFVLYQIWLFVAPGLYRHERRAVAGFVLTSTFLFLCGIAFGYFIMLPYILRFLISFQGPFRPFISINEYWDLILIILLGLGVIFEMPIIIFFLSVFGLVTPKFLLKNFRYAMLIITIVAAIVTPTPDATTMLIFMAPMVLLYFIGIIVSFFVVRRKRARALASGEAH
jgi:sec-independent protein translocase protein TatC